MAKVTPGFKLYLYQLLSRELGFGKQTLLPQVEEVLAADDIIPADLECKTVQEVAEACSDFLKVTVFKKGRVYATVMRNDEWDQMLAVPQEKPATKKGGSSGGPKTWKKKKSGKKALKAVKPGKQRRDREAAEAQAAAERAEAERIAAEQAEAERLAAEQAEAERAAAEAEAERVAAEAEGDATETVEASTEAPKEGHNLDGDAGSEDTEDSPAHSADIVAETPAPIDVAVPQTSDAATTSSLTDGPIARTIAEILAETRATEAQAAQATPAQGRESEVAVAPQPTSAPALTTEEDLPTPENAPQHVASTASATSPLHAPATESTDAPANAPASSAESMLTPPAASPAESTVREDTTEPTPAQKPAPLAPEPSPISITITYDPYEDMERELERQRSQMPAEPLRKQPPTNADAQAAKPAIPLTDLPQHFGSEVSCKDALLRTLYQLLPYDVDPMAVLDEDWRMARSTGSLSGSRHRVTFPLRYLHEDGSPVTVTLRKTTKSSFGKQWNLTLVDGDDGTGTTHLSVGYEGLPSVDEGAWSDLSGSASSDASSSPTRALAQQVVIGTWDSFLGALAAMAAPERWNYPGEGVGKQSRYGILREYLATTFLRASRQERIAQAADGSFAAFHTGLSTVLGDDIYACLAKRTGDIPWQFLGFAPAGSGELGARLTGTVAELPEPATYLESLNDVLADHKRLVILDTEAILGRQLGHLPRAFLLERLESNAEAREILEQGEALSNDDLSRLARVIKSDTSAYRRLRRALDDAIEQAMRAARASYRLAAPVFDPADNKTKLLVPLCLVEDNRADCALVLDLQPSGAYRAAAILSLPRAYACARVISREQPRWLTL